MGEALFLSRIVVVVDDLHFHVIAAFGDFRNAPKDLDHNLFRICLPRGYACDA